MRLSRKDIAPLKDLRWEEWSKPLYAFLVEPRSWVALKAWRPPVRLDGWRLRNCIAYLEEKGHIKHYVEKKKLYWVQTTALFAYLPQPGPEELAQLMLPDDQDPEQVEGSEEEDDERLA